MAEQIMTDSDKRLYGLQIIVSDWAHQYCIQYNADKQDITVSFVNFVDGHVKSVIFGWKDDINDLRNKTKKFMKFFKRDSVTGCILYNDEFRHLYKAVFKE